MRNALTACLILIMAVGGLGVPRFGFGVLPPEEAGVSISVELAGEGEPPPPAPGQGIFTGPFVPPPLGILVLQGFAPPGSFLTVSRNTSVGATLEVSRDGTFEVAFSSLSESIYELRLFVEDPEGNVSQTIVLSSVPVFRSGTTTVSNIVLPPTFVVDTPRIETGKSVRMHGFTAPRSSVILVAFSSRDFFPSSPVLFVTKTTSDSRGLWNISFPAGELSQGNFKLKAQTQLATGLFSNFSQLLDLEVLSAIPSVSPEKPGEIPPAIPPTTPSSPEISPRPSLPESLFLKVDLNGDGKVDIIDLSILLYNWGVPKNPRADFNGDGIADLVDFSIMLFYWSG